jgi:hypothetical protein
LGHCLLFNTPEAVHERLPHVTADRRLDSSGVILQERSMLLILLYPGEVWRDSSKRIEQIRKAYKQAFHQQSVLRADRRCERVGF